MFSLVTYIVSRAALILAELLAVRSASSSEAALTLRTTSSILPLTSSGSETGPMPAAFAAFRNPEKSLRFPAVSSARATT